MQENIHHNATHISSRLKPVRKQSSLIDISSRFASLSRPSSKDTNLFQEQFYTLILNTSSMERKTIAETLAHSEYVPKPIIIFFAMEEIAIAQPALLHSPVLQPRDINLIVDKCAFAHAKILARRDNLDSSNVSGLLKLDNEAGQIRGILRENASLANIPQIFDTSHNEAWASIPADSTIERKTTDIKPEISNTSKDISKSLLELANKGGRLKRKPVGKAVKLSSTPITLKQLEIQLLAYARSKDFEGFASSISDCCGLNTQIISNLLQEQDAGMLATLLRAIEVTDVTTARILLLANNDIGRNASIFKVVMEKYRKLDRTECIKFYERLGADFTQPNVINANNYSSTRYALSLAARNRRAALLARQDAKIKNQDVVKLTA